MDLYYKYLYIIICFKFIIFIYYICVILSLETFLGIGPFSDHDKFYVIRFVLLSIYEFVYD